MISEDEKALRELIKPRFEGRSQEEERFVATLLDLKMSQKFEKENFSETSLTPQKALGSIVSLLKALDKAESYFYNLQSHHKPTEKPSAMTVENTPEELVFKRSRTGMLVALGRDENYALSWLPEVLETMRAAVKEEVYTLVHSQKTDKAIKEMGLVMLGVFCEEVGIRYSYAPRSYFYRLAQWLLCDLNDPNGKDPDPKASIQNAKPLFLRVISGGIKISKK